MNTYGSLRRSAKLYGLGLRVLWYGSFNMYEYQSLTVLAKP